MPKKLAPVVMSWGNVTIMKNIRTPQNGEGARYVARIFLDANHSSMLNHKLPMFLDQNSDFSQTRNFLEFLAAFFIKLPRNKFF